MLSLKEIPGVGDSLAEKLIFEIGSLVDVERVIKDGDVSALSSIEAVSYTHLTLPTIYSV